MADLISKSPIFIDSATAGNVFLRTVQKWSVTDDSDLEPVFGTGDDEPIGMAEKPGAGAIDLEVRRVASPEVDWARLKRLKERFSLTTVDNPGGRRTQYAGCRVANVAPDSDDQGQHIVKVKVVYAKEQDL